MNAKIVGLERFWRIFRLLFHWFGLFFHGCRYYTRTAPGIHLLRTFFTQRYLCTEKVQRRYGASTIQVRRRYDAEVFLIQCRGIVSQE